MKKYNKYILNFLVDSAIISFSFLFMIWLKPASLRFYLPAYIKPFLGFAAIWIAISVLMDKYRSFNATLIKSMKIVIRSNIYIVAIVLLLIYGFNRLSYSRMIVFGTIVLSTLLEIMIVFYNAVKKQSEDFDKDLSLKLTKKAQYVKPEFTKSNAITPFPELKENKTSVELKLKEKFLSKYPDLFDFISAEIDLNCIEIDLSRVIFSKTYFNIENYEEQSQQFFLNLHRVNDIKRINKYMIKVNENLKLGGYYIGNCLTIDDIHSKIQRKYSPIIATIVLDLNFIFNRVIPKLPILKQLYFLFTRGKGRHLSKAEILGRLYYCGFKVKSIKTINDKLFFIAQKIAEPSKDTDPSFGPIIKLKRVGYQGESIYVYKFRTMHPYSEYLQQYIFDQSNLEKSGKFKDDFRITHWGKVFRKLWIDELPQFINVFRGQIGIVGVRALSEHYYSLYPRELQLLRVKYKPGLIPPYYVDLPKNFDEIVKSEMKYLNKREQKPFLTQIEYFFKAWINIIFRNARSN